MRMTAEYPTEANTDVEVPKSLEVHTTRVFTVVVIITNVIGNISLGRGMHAVGKIVSASPLDYVRAFANPWTIAGVCVLVVWMLTDLALLSRADLSFVMPVTASTYVLIALAGRLLLHEQISWVRWTGVVVITLGAALVGKTPVRTTKPQPEHLR
ncbi:MAG: transporter [Acidobacteria bacterium]|nr:MAG: transporter [Acidobacteriota bacterium]PYX64634.1 MAG: transporter [Acidobacteriota bacterium]